MTIYVQMKYTTDNDFIKLIETSPSTEYKEMLEELRQNLLNRDYLNEEVFSLIFEAAECRYMYDIAKRHEAQATEDGDHAV